MQDITFPTDIASVTARIERIDPLAYAKTRNHTDGAVTLLSPYLSRGVISTTTILESLVRRGYSFRECETLVRELAWRDYFQRVWQVRDVSQHLRDQPQPEVREGVMPVALERANTGIEGIDRAVRGLYETGYMHNHCRLYTAALACHAAHCHWLTPARWMYYHLIDGDWASNACSWQWVAGTGSSKPYVANQENINRFTSTSQTGTFLDIPYEQLISMPVPPALEQATAPLLETPLQTVPLPPLDAVSVEEDVGTIHLYNYYNLDPHWRSRERAIRILLLEPDVFRRYPVGRRSVEFMFSLAGNIPGLRVFVGSFAQLKERFRGAVIRYREHPLNHHYDGQADARDWMNPAVEGYFPSFSGYWRRSEPYIRERFPSGIT